MCVCVCVCACMRMCVYIYIFKKLLVDFTGCMYIKIICCKSKHYIVLIINEL